MENLQAQLIWPPMLVCRGPNGRVSVRSAQRRTLIFTRHVLSNRVLQLLTCSDRSPQVVVCGLLSNSVHVQTLHIGHVIFNSSPSMESRPAALCNISLTRSAESSPRSLIDNHYGTKSNRFKTSHNSREPILRCHKLGVRTVERAGDFRMKLRPSWTSIPPARLSCRLRYSPRVTPA